MTMNHVGPFRWATPKMATVGAKIKASCSMNQLGSEITPLNQKVTEIATGVRERFTIPDIPGGRAHSLFCPGPPNNAVFLVVQDLLGMGHLFGNTFI